MRNFYLHELVDRHTFETKGEEAWHLFNPLLLQALDNLRDFFDAPITVNNWKSMKGGYEWRGYRTPEKAQELGSSRSSHAFMKSEDGKWIPMCNAIDCDVKGYTAEQARSIIKMHKDDPLLCHIMRVEGGKSWLHFDLLHVPNRIHEFRA